jgi:hypothetical protein
VARSDEQVIEEFGEAVNMSREELEDRLQTGEYKEVGQKDGGESESHESGAGSSNYSTKIGPTTPTTCAASSPTSTATRPRSPKRRTSNTPTGATPSCDIRMQRTAGLRVYTTLAKEPGVELALN